MRLRLIPPGRLPSGRTVAGGYWIGACEVTQREFEEVTRRNRSRFRAGQGSGADHPVEAVSLQEAEEFCRALSERPEERQAERAYRLPSEDQWEHACRSAVAFCRLLSACFVG